MKKTIILLLVLVVTAQPLLASQTIYSWTTPQIIPINGVFETPVPINCAPFSKVRLIIMGLPNFTGNIQKFDVEIISTDANSLYTFAQFTGIPVRLNEVIELPPSQIKVKVRSRVPARYKIIVLG
jgi:hypothetical protein